MPNLSGMMKENYTVKRGDTLGEIAMQHQTTVDSIARINEINNPDRIFPGQKLKINFEDLQEYPEYKIRRDDTLGHIAKAHGVTIERLQELNKIQDPNLIYEGQSLRVPKSLEQVQHKFPVSKNWSEAKGEISELDKKLTDLERVTFFQNVNHPDEHYLVEDKKAKTVSLYKGKYLMYTYDVATGKNPGDEMTTSVGNRQGVAISGMGNMSTPAGKFTISGVGEYKGAPSFTRAVPAYSSPGKPYNTASSMHAGYVPKNKEKCNISNGCTRMKKEDLRQLKDFLDIGTNVYVLPEDKGNRYSLSPDGIHFISNDIGKTPSYHPKSTYKEIDITIPKKLQGNQTVYDFVGTLEDKKEEMMNLLGISNKLYNDLAKLSLGMLGQEGSFGKPGVRGSIGRLMDQVALAMDKNASLGWTQVRLTSIPKEAITKYGITREKLNDDPKYMAIGTIAALSSMMKNEVPYWKKKFPDFKDTEILSYLYNNRDELQGGTATPDQSNYLANVNQYSDPFKISQESYFNKGGLIGSKQIH